MHEPALTVEAFPEEVRVVVGAVARVTVPRQGYTSSVVLVDGRHGAVAVKRARGARFGDWLAREYAVLQALASSRLPAPAPLAFLRRETAAGPESWLVMERLPGEPIRAVLRIETEPATRARLLRAFGATLAQIHATAAPPALARAGATWLRAMLDEAAVNLARGGGYGSPALLARLEREQPAAIPPTLIHGDFTIDNTLVDGGVVTGVIDWSGGALGDPRYDVALAVRPKAEAFREPDERRAFFEGYGRPPLDAATERYFVALYEFF